MPPEAREATAVSLEAGGAEGAEGAGGAATGQGRWRKRILSGGVLAGVLFLDLATKVVIQRTFRLHESLPVMGDFFRLTYIFNPGAAFGLYLGPQSRVIFLLLSIVALVVLVAMYRKTGAEHTLRLAAMGSVGGGALGNIVDRIRSPAGVVDFLDFGIGDLRWPVFNVADVAVTVGASLLFLSFWAEDRGARRTPEQG